MYKFLLVGALVVASGFIAYFGDQLGRVLGKKRLTLWGMRPRSTATFISVVAGVMVLVITIVALLLVNADVRRAFLEVDRIHAERKDLRQETTSLKNENAGLKNDNVRLIEEGKLLLEGMDRLLIESEGLKVKNNNLIRQRDDFSKEIISVREQVADLEGQRVDLEGQRVDLVKEVARLDGEMIRLETARLELEQEIQVASARKEEAERGSFEFAGRTLAEVKRLRNQLERRRSQLERYTRQIELKDAYITRLLMESDFAFRPGTVLASGLIGGTEDKPKVFSSLQGLLKLANEAAKKTGARGEDGWAILVSEKRLSEPGVSADRLLGESELIDAAADRICAELDPLLVEVFAVRNTLIGEQVPVDFALRLNELVFHESELLVRHEVDGGKSVASICEDLVKMLQVDVYRLVKDRGLRRTKVDGNDEHGSVNIFKLINAAEAVKKVGGKVPVEVRALEDIHEAGPLVVEFLVVLEE